MIYVDTNVWLDFINAQRKETLLSRSKKSVQFFDLFSYFNFIELSAKLREQILHLKLLGKGCSVFELSKRAKQERWEEMDEESFEKDFIAVTNMPCVSIGYLEPQSLSETEMENLSNLIGFRLEMPEAFHILLALQKKCIHFVTNDKPLRESLNDAQKKGSFLKKIKIISPEQFNSKILTTNY